MSQREGGGGQKSAQTVSHIILMAPQYFLTFAIKI